MNPNLLRIEGAIGVLEAIWRRLALQGVRNLVRRSLKQWFFLLLQPKRFRKQLVVLDQVFAVFVLVRLLWQDDLGHHLFHGLLAAVVTARFQEARVQSYLADAGFGVEHVALSVLELVEIKPCVLY